MALPKPCRFSSLSIANLRLKVKLGCGEEERQIPQFVSFAAEVRFKDLPQGCFSDRLDETICYALLSDKIRSLCNNNEYHLIEKLGWDVYAAIKGGFARSGRPSNHRNQGKTSHPRPSRGIHVYARGLGLRKNASSWDRQ